MLNLPDYQETNQIYAGTNTLVYRAIRASDRQPAIVKVLRNPYPNVDEGTGGLLPIVPEGDRTFILHYQGITIAIVF